MAVALQTLLASAARTTSGASDAFDLPGTAREMLLFINCTAASGTDETLDVTYEVSNDGGTTWFTHTSATQITAAGKQLLKLTSVGGTGRVSYAIGGTDTPSFTFEVVAEPKWGV